MKISAFIFINTKASSFFFRSFLGNQTVYDFTKTQNDLTEEFIQSYKTSDGNSVRDKIWDVLDAINELGFPTYQITAKFGNRYFFYDGPNWHFRVFMRDSSRSLEETHVLKVSSYKLNKVSKDGNFMSYSSCYTLNEQIVKNITSGQDIETISSVKGHTVSWNKDSTGFIYLHEEKPKRGHKAKIFLKFPKLGTDQSSDVFIDDLSPVENGLTIIKYTQPKLTSDDKYIILTNETMSAFNIEEDYTVGYLYTEYDNINWRPLNPGNKEQRLEYIDSDKSHPNIIYTKVFNFISSLAGISILKMDLNSDPVTAEIIADGWKEPYPNRGLLDACIINGDTLVLSSVYYFNTEYIENGILEVKDLKTLATLYKKTEVASKFEISCSRNEVLIQKSSMDLFKSNFVIDFIKSPLEMTELNFTTKPQPQPEGLEKLRDYETTVGTYRTKDGSKLPIYIVHKKDFVPQGNSPVMLKLKFRNLLATTESVFIGMFNGILAIPMYRQSRLNTNGKVDGQTSLDDVISSVEYLIERNYTSPGKIFLTHAEYDYEFWQDVNIPMAVLSRPELFAGASISNRVLDLVKSTNKTECLKFPVQDTGYCFNQTVLEETMRMSPLQNIKQGVKYPPQLIRYRPDNIEDDHAYLRKINEASEGSPVFITTAGSEHKWSISAENKNRGNADTLSFAAKVLGLSWKL